LIVSPALIFSNCSNSHSQTAKKDLSPEEFAGKMQELPDAPIVDVRTPEEFSQAHLVNALNFDWNGNSFDQQISELDKSQPVLVYCRSGARSAAAAKSMRSQGFTEVYELKGGIMNWIAANKPVTEN